LTILRKTDPAAPAVVGVKMIPAAETEVAPSTKHSDSTVLYHLRGAAAPSSTTVFQEVLDAPPGPDEEWHWAIVEAKGVPPQMPIPIPQPDRGGAPTPPAGH